MENTKLVQEFGVKPISQDLIDRFVQVTGKPVHHFLTRGIFCGHRDLEKILDAYEAKQPFYLYTGRGPSSESLHLGHLVALDFTKYLQDTFDVPLVIQMTDDEKFLRNPQRSLQDIENFTNENLKDLIALGFNPKKTFIFRDTEYIQTMYPNILRFSRHVTLSQIKATFGLTDSDQVGVAAFPIVQAVPSIPSTFPQLFPYTPTKMRCLIPCAMDQDIYFRITRDVCQKLKEHKPSLIESGFLPDLRGPKLEEIVKEDATTSSKSLAELSKMSSTSKMENPAVIFLNFPPKKVKKIVNKYAFSGGQALAEDHRKMGGDPDRDLSYQYLRFFLPDDNDLYRIKDEFKTGKLLCGEIKAILIKLLNERLQQFQETRAQITPDLIEEFTTPRCLIE